MPRRLLFKEDQLSTSINPPSGYKFIGYDSGTFSERQSDGDVVPIGGVSVLTTTVVNISSAQILAMGTSAIELLPAPGAGKYYFIDNIILEYTGGTTDYEFVSNGIDHVSIPSYALLDPQFMQSGNAVKIVTSGGYIDVLTTQVESSFGALINDSVSLTTNSNNNPTLGDGTLRVIITYTIRTFGA